MAYTRREYQSTDVAEIAAMLNARRDIPRAVVDGAGNIRLVRYVPFSSSKTVIEDEQGQLVGYAYVADKENSFIFEVGGGVHPDHFNNGVGSLLIKWAQEESQRLSKNAPAGVKCVLQVNIFESEQETINLFEETGFEKVREWAHYEIHFKNTPKAPDLLDRLIIREFDLDRNEDWELVTPVQDAAFMDHWGAYTLMPVETPESEEKKYDNETPQDFSFSNMQGYCFIAFIGAETAGGILCNGKLVEYQNTGRVGSIFSNPKFRRRGVGRALMLSAFNAFYKNGIRHVILDTDSQSFSDSSQFYTRLGMSIYRKEFLYEKEIRAGQEIRRLVK